MGILTKVVLGTSVLFLAACQTTNADEDTERGIAAFSDDIRLGEEVSKICFAGQIDGFRDTRRDTVILESGVRDEYIVEVMGGCQNLRHAGSIALDTNMSCLHKFDNIIVFDSAFATKTTPFSQERCAIKSIYKWDEDASEKNNNEEPEIDLSKRPVK